MGQKRYSAARTVVKPTLMSVGVAGLVRGTEVVVAQQPAFAF